MEGRKDGKSKKEDKIQAEADFYRLLHSDKVTAEQINKYRVSEGGKHYLEKHKKDAEKISRLYAIKKNAEELMSEHKHISESFAIERGRVANDLKIKMDEVGKIISGYKVNAGDIPDENKREKEIREKEKQDLKDSVTGLSKELSKDFETFTDFSKKLSEQVGAEIKQDNSGLEKWIGIAYDCFKAGDIALAEKMVAKINIRAGINPLDRAQQHEAVLDSLKKAGLSEESIEKLKYIMPLSFMDNNPAKKVLMESVAGIAPAANIERFRASIERFIDGALKMQEYDVISVADAQQLKSASGEGEQAKIKSRYFNAEKMSDTIDQAVIQPFKEIVKSASWAAKPHKGMGQRDSIMGQMGSRRSSSAPGAEAKEVNLNPSELPPLPSVPKSGTTASITMGLRRAESGASTGVAARSRKRAEARGGGSFSKKEIDEAMAKEKEAKQPYVTREPADLVTDTSPAQPVSVEGDEPTRRGPGLGRRNE